MKLEIKNVSKKFSDKLAVDEVSATLREGVYGLLGANGAGKTSLIKMITGISEPTSGEIFLDGKNIKDLKEKYRDQLGFLPQDFICAPEFTVNSFLEYMAALKGIDRKTGKKRIGEVLELMNLQDVKNKKVVKLSGGMRRRVGICQSILNKPKLLILDEPTSGLDPGERIRLRNFITEYAKDRIVLLSTHIVSDIEYISTDNLVMKNGKIVAEGTTDRLIDMIKDRVYECEVSHSKLLEIASQLNLVNIRQVENGDLVIRYVAEDTGVLENSERVESHLEDFYLWIFPEDRSYKVD